MWRALGPTLALAALTSCQGQAPPTPGLLGLPPPVIFAHGGGSGEAPESTLFAFQRVARLFPEMVVEMDVRLSRDGQLVVIHDATVDRTTNGTGRVEDLTVAELRALDAGFCATPGQGRGTAPRGSCHAADAQPFPFRGQGHHVPTLAEVLAGLPPHTRLGIELKVPGAESLMANQVRASGRLGRVIVGSSQDDIAERLKTLLPGAMHYLPRGRATCLGLGAKLGLGFLGCGGYHVFASPPGGLGLDLLTPSVVRGAHARGIPIVYWTLNSEDELVRAFRAGAAGVMSDYPTRAAEVRTRTAVSAGRVVPPPATSTPARSNAPVP